MEIFSRPIGVFAVAAAVCLPLAACGSAQQSVGSRADASPVRAATSVQPPSTQVSVGGKSTQPAGRETVKRPTQNAPSVQANVTATSRFKLYELRTGGDKGYFYTLNKTEASNAASRYRFTRVTHNLGYLSSKPFRGSMVVYRLRYKPFSSYLATISPSERTKLINSGQFVYEGILGYSSGSKSGKTLLWRVAKNSQWRIVRHDEVGSLVRQGWRSDGPLGYAWK